jgi:hypothetical protein
MQILGNRESKMTKKERSNNPQIIISFCFYEIVFTAWVIGKFPVLGKSDRLKHQYLSES